MSWHKTSLVLEFSVTTHMSQLVASLLSSFLYLIQWSVWPIHIWKTWFQPCFNPDAHTKSITAILYMEYLINNTINEAILVASIYWKHRMVEPPTNDITEGGITNTCTVGESATVVKVLWSKSWLFLDLWLQVFLNGWHLTLVLL